MNRFFVSIALSIGVLCSACVQHGSYGNYGNYGNYGDNPFGLGGVVSNPFGSSMYSGMQGVPSTFEEFQSRGYNMQTSPEGAVKMYFDAVFVYINTQGGLEAKKMLAYIMNEPMTWTGSAAHATFKSRLHDPNQHHIFRSFAVGSSPENNYSMSPENYSISITNIAPESDYMRVNIVSSGADSPRIVWVQQFDDGLWYVINNAGTYAGVRFPAYN